MDQKTRAKLRLHLRAEKALGLDALPIAKRRGGNQPLETKEQAVVSRVNEPRSSRVAAPVEKKSPGLVARAAQAPVAPPAAVMTRSPFTSAVLSTEAKKIQLSQLNEDAVKKCVRCRLHETRTNTVFGEGSPSAEIFFIGEGPGENEDLSGRPFVGRAGELLNKMIAGMGLSREEVFIANIVKCRPPNNRAPIPDEVAACTPFLERQLEIVRPKVIVTLGLPAAQYMLQSKLSMGKLRSVWHDWRGIKLMPTYHPAYVLRNYTEETRKAVWDDLKKVMNELGLKAVKK